MPYDVDDDSRAARRSRLLAEKPERQYFPPRRCLVLNRMATNTDHNPGEVIMFDGPVGESIRELTEQELQEFSDHSSRENAMTPPERGSPDAFQEKARSDLVLQALAKIDQDVDGNWTESGQPTVNAVNRALMALSATHPETSRAEIRKYAQTFRRTSTGQVS